jgi:hypothetical protein
LFWTVLSGGPRLDGTEIRGVANDPEPHCRDITRRKPMNIDLKAPDISESNISKLNRII